MKLTSVKGRNRIAQRCAETLRIGPVGLRFAWIVYREGEPCFDQHCLSIDEDFRNIPMRQTVSED